MLCINKDRDCITFYVQTSVRNENFKENKQRDREYEKRIESNENVRQTYKVDSIGDTDGK